MTGPFPEIALSIFDQTLAFRAIFTVVLKFCCKLTLNIGGIFGFVYDQHSLPLYKGVKVKSGIKRFTSINNRLFRKHKALWQRDSVGVSQSFVFRRSRSLTGFVVFISLMMGGVILGFTLGYINHPERTSPLERNRVSNFAGYVLVWWVSALSSDPSLDGDNSYIFVSH